MSASHLSCNRCGTICIIAVSPAFTASSMFIPRQETGRFGFEKNRFKFFNSFNAEHAKDALYFILYVWKQLGFNQMQDELHVAGNVPDKDWFLYNTKLYIKKTFILNPAAEFNRAPITEIKGLPFDLMALYLSK